MAISREPREVSENRWYQNINKKSEKVSKILKTWILVEFFGFLGEFFGFLGDIFEFFGEILDFFACCISQIYFSGAQLK